MVKRLLFVMFLVWGNYAFGQLTDCKVISPALSDSYSGDCKKGLAHGRGVAQGRDRYEGEFSKGVPDGTGTYTWENGSFYEGQFKNGLKDGKGKMVTSDSTITGIWEKDHYVGKESKAAYQIHSTVGVSRYTFKKTVAAMPGVKLRITQVGADNLGIEDFSLAYDSGDEYRVGNVFGIQNILFPLRVSVRYRTWNAFHTAQYDVFFEYTINEPGLWEVMISN